MCPLSAISIAPSTETRDDDAALEIRASAELAITPVAGSCRISITGPESRSARDWGTPVAGVRSFVPFAGVRAACARGATTAVGLVSAAAAHSLLQYARTLPSRIFAAGARSGSTGLPHT